MRVLLDECLPRRLKHDLPGHEVLTVVEASWAGKKNGELLQLAAEHFDAFITVDRGIPASAERRSPEHYPGRAHRLDESTWEFAPIGVCAH